MAGAVPASPRIQFPSSSGGILPAGVVDVYLAGTTTRTNTWQDKALTVLNTNPIILDVAGSCLLLTDPSQSYKFVVSDVNGAVQYTVDNIMGVGTFPTVAQFVNDKFSGNGSQTTFSLSVTPTGKNNTEVFIAGIYQPKAAYSLVGNAITFVSAPASGTNNIEVNTLNVTDYAAVSANITAQVAAAAASAASAAHIYASTYAVAPVTRPDGSAIQAGDIYFGTDGYEYAYIGGAWVNQTSASAASAAAALVSQNAASTSATSAAGSANAALGYSNTATSASATAGVYPNTAASNVPRGLTQASVGAITAGSGGTNGTFALAWSSGNFSVNPTGTFIVAGGVVTAVTITGPGLYIGSSPTVPTPSFAASSGLSGAAVALTAQLLVASGQGYWALSADGTMLDHYVNSSGVATADSSVASLPTAGLLQAGFGPIGWGILDSLGNVALSVESDGTVTAHTLRVVNSLSAPSIAGSRVTYLTSYAGADTTGASFSDGAMALALAAGYKTIVIPDNATFKLANAYTIPDDVSIIGEGWTAVLHYTGNGRLFTMGARSKVKTMKIIGDGKASGKTAQCAVYADGKDLWLVDEVWCDAMAGAFASGGGPFFITNQVPVGGVYDGGRIVKPRVTNSSDSYVLSTRGEYCHLLEPEAFACDRAFYSQGGNFCVTAPKFTACGTAVEVQPDTNDSHGQIVGGQINHNTNYAFKVGAIANGMEVIGTMIFNSNFDVQPGTAGVSFNACVLSGSSNTILSNGNMYVSNSRYIASSYAVTGTVVESNNRHA